MIDHTTSNNTALDGAPSPAPRSWTLTPSEFTATVERAEKINARAAKRGFTGRIAVTGNERRVTEKDSAGLPRTRVLVDVEISGESPSYSGWHFLAAVDTVQTSDGADFVLRLSPGIDESGVDRSILKPGYCAHCKVVRPNRKYTYLVRNTKTGETVQVGSTCIKDFTGWQGRPVFISVDDVKRDLDGFLGGLASAGAAYAPETVVAAAWAAKQVYGWFPASTDLGTPTRERVSAYLYGHDKAAQEIQGALSPEIQTATEKAEEIIAALLNNLEGDGDYTTNLRVALRADHVAPKHMGLVVSAVAVYDQMISKHTRKPAGRSQKPNSQYFGAVGEKITLAGRVVRLVATESHYGYAPSTSMLVIVEAGTAVAKMFTSAAWAFDVEEGDEVTITGTIKDHEEYQGTKQTVLTRPKRIDT